MLGAADLDGRPSGLRVHTRLEETLGVVDLVLLDVGAYFHELLVRLNGALEVGHVVVAVAEEGEGSTGAGEVLEFELRIVGGEEIEGVWRALKVALEFANIRRRLPGERVNV